MSVLKVGRAIRFQHNLKQRVTYLRLRTKELINENFRKIKTLYISKFARSRIINSLCRSPQRKWTI